MPKIKPKLGRPTVEDPRTQHLKTVVTQTEAAFVREQATRTNSTVSTLLRSYVLKAMRLAPGTHTFTLWLEGRPTQTDEDFDAAAKDLYEAGCDDGLFGHEVGKLYVTFDRVAPSLAHGIQTATDDVKAAGFTVTAVTVEDLDK